jgi:hypothetical protein
MHPSGSISNHKSEPVSIGQPGKQPSPREFTERPIASAGRPVIARLLA